MVILYRHGWHFSGAVCLAWISGCTPSAGETEHTSTQTTDPEMVDERLFGMFHSAHALGWKNDDPGTGIAWSQFEIRSNKTIVYHRVDCEVELDVIDLTWSYDPAEQAIHILPNAGERVDLGDGLCTFGAIELRLGGACDELIMAWTDCDGEDGSSRYLPGRLCAEASAEECVTEIVWCDENPLPACQAAP